MNIILKSDVWQTHIRLSFSRLSLGVVQALFALAGLLSLGPANSIMEINPLTCVSE